MAAGQGQQALEDREPGPGDEDAERGQQRPEVPFLTVAELVVRVGGAASNVAYSVSPMAKT